MSRYIDADALLQEATIHPCHNRAFKAGAFAMKCMITSAPAADVAPVAGAKWGKDKDTIKCSNCGFGMFKTGYFFRNGVCFSADDGNFIPSYCPDCGARMDLEDEP